MQFAIGLNTAPASKAPRPLAAIAYAWHSVIAHELDSYRPEKHYMRGPGPKWREKHAHAIPLQHGRSMANTGSTEFSCRPAEHAGANAFSAAR